MGIVAGAGLCLAVLGASQEAFALTSFTPSNASALTNATVNDLLKTVILGAEHRAYQPATPLGNAFGLDIGIEVTAIQASQDFQDALKLATGKSSIPALIPLPKLNVHKGLPWGLNIGASYVGYQGYRILGGDIQWAFVSPTVIRPTMAIRLGGTYTDLFFMKGRTYKLDFLVSKNLAYLIDPYIGLGYINGSGELNVPLQIQGAPAGLPTSVSGHQSFGTGHFFVGVPLNVLILHLTAEYDYIFTGGVRTFGAKISFAF
jgi:hypothetical protein